MFVYSSLRSIHHMVVWFNELQLALLFHEEYYDALGCFVVHNVFWGLNPFEVRPSNCILHVLKKLLLSRPSIGVVKIAFAL
jgi:hypothetical protein